MIDNRSAVYAIERAHDAQPYCECGQFTTVSEQAGRVWLLCSALLVPRDGRLGRLFAALSSAMHTRRLVIDLRDGAAHT